MQLVLIIAGEEHAHELRSVLIEHGYRATEIGSNGEFLQYGETVLLLGLEEHEIDPMIEVLKQECPCHGHKDAPFREHVKLYVLNTDGYHRLHD